MAPKSKHRAGPSENAATASSHAVGKQRSGHAAKPRGRRQFKSDRYAWNVSLLYTGDRFSAYVACVSANRMSLFKRHYKLETVAALAADLAKAVVQGGNSFKRLNFPVQHRHQIPVDVLAAASQIRRDLMDLDEAAATPKTMELVMKVIRDIDDSVGEYTRNHSIPATMVQEITGQLAVAREVVNQALTAFERREHDNPQQEDGGHLEDIDEPDDVAPPSRKWVIPMPITVDQDLCTRPVLQRMERRVEYKLVVETVEEGRFRIGFAPEETDEEGLKRRHDVSVHPAAQTVVSVQHMQGTPTSPASAAGPSEGPYLSVGTKNAPTQDAAGSKSPQMPSDTLSRETNTDERNIVDSQERRCEGDGAKRPVESTAYSEDRAQPVHVAADDPNMPSGHTPSLVTDGIHTSDLCWETNGRDHHGIMLQGISSGNPSITIPVSRKNLEYLYLRQETVYKLMTLQKMLQAKGWDLAGAGIDVLTGGLVFVNRIDEHKLRRIECWDAETMHIQLEDGGVVMPFDLCNRRLERNNRCIDFAIQEYKHQIDSGAFPKLEIVEVLNVFFRLLSCTQAVQDFAEPQNQMGLMKDLVDRLASGASPSFVSSFSQHFDQIDSSRIEAPTRHGAEIQEQYASWLYGSNVELDTTPSINIEEDLKIYSESMLAFRAAQGFHIFQGDEEQVANVHPEQHSLVEGESQSEADGCASRKRKSRDDGGDEEGQAKKMMV